MFNFGDFGDLKQLARSTSFVVEVSKAMYITIDLMVDISKYCFNHKNIEFIMHNILDEFLFKSFI